MGQVVNLSTPAGNNDSPERYENVNLSGINLQGGGGGGGPAVDAETQGYVDKFMEAVKAQNDARFAEILAKLDQMPKFWPLVMSGFIGIFGAIGLVFAVLAYASDRFDSGIVAMGAVEESIDAQREVNAAQDARLDRILKMLEERNTSP